MPTTTILRLLSGWACVAAVFTLGARLDEASGLVQVAGFAVILGVVMWSAFGVVTEAEHLADLLGEPFGTLVLTLAIVIIEVALILAVMLGGKDAPTLGRDTMFAVLMCVLDGIVGLGLVVGGLRHRTQGYSLQGASAFLAVIIPLSVIVFVLPNFTRSAAGGTLTSFQEVAFSILVVLLYAVFLYVLTARHLDFFVEPSSEEKVTDEAKLDGGIGAVALHAVLLVLSVLPIVLLSKPLGKLLDHGLAAAKLPEALGGVLIAMIVLAPEAITALKAVSANQLQRGINLLLGAAASTIGLTVPAIVAVAAFTGTSLVLGVSPAEMVLLATTLVLCTLTFSGARTTTLEGAMHLVMFLVYLTLIFSP